MTNEEFIKNIQSRFPDIYPENKFDLLVSSLEKISPIIRKSLEEFLQSGNHLEINLLGYSIEKLTKEHGMNEIAGYLTLDWIVREPDKAVESLKKGHDYVDTSRM